MDLGILAKVSMTVSAAMIAVLAITLWWKRSKRTTIPSMWTVIGHVSHLRIYPLKSGKGVECETLTCTSRGAAYGDAKDRMFLVLDSNRKCKSGREYPRLTQITAEVTEGRLRLSGPDSDAAIEVDFPQTGDPVEVKIWEAAAQGLDCGDDVSRWLTMYLRSEVPLRLLYRASGLIDKDFNPGMKKLFGLTKATPSKTDAGLFSDTFSYHLISEASVNELNRRIPDAHVTPFHFRPNIVVSGHKLLPHEEDSWHWVKIGDVIFQLLAPCMRCSFTTIDPQSAEKSASGEPITALRRYRLVRDPQIRKIVYTPTMGIYIGVRSDGVISVGDAVSVPGIS